MTRLTRREFWGVPRFDFDHTGAGRNAHRDTAGIRARVLSPLTPGARNRRGASGVAFVRHLNTWVAGEAIPAYLRRWHAIAVMSLSGPEATAAEFGHAVQESGMVGGTT